METETYPYRSVHRIFTKTVYRFKWLPNFESRRIRQECWPIKNLKSYGWFVRIFECYSFKSILDYRKMSKFLLQVFFFLQKMILNRATRPFHKKIDELGILLSLAHFSGGFGFFQMHFSLRNWTKKLFLCFIFGLKIN